ncbi:3'-5' exonuclease [Vermiconidia calcicola]|uniref:3'-5' exonuclease n=1 Tax=Vermiconidia calcicola TaxID=1690605 RepID=A0ACC3NQL5_9PEZI|nr:3'-5' exonuclease [Vermiconidia calcicola]
MPGLDLTQLSSNWKKLQDKLQAEKKQEPESNGLKRKRPDEKNRKTNGYKRARIADSTLYGPVKSRKKMGLASSKPEEERKVDRKNSDFAKKHDLAPEDVSAAYGNTQRKHIDDINGGLHASHKAGKYVSLDCEMVGTGPPPYTDNVLARASLVNFHGEQIYDAYVLPPPGIEVQDYRTFVSGIKPTHLVEGYARPFTEVQKDVANLLDGRILVGHALRNDLQVLMLSHPRRDMRDTSRHPKWRLENGGRPPALRKLAKMQLGMEIQTGEHSSVEDARAAMMLFRKDKMGFEEENVRRFGRHSTFQPKGLKQVNGAVPPRQSPDDNEESEEDEEDEDLDLLDGEEDAEAVAEGTSAMGTSTPNTKKKKKKKKRTKRK